MARHTISLKGHYLRKEGEASAAVKPGMLVEWDTDIETVQPHSTGNGVARKAFALENDLIGKGIDDAYASGDMVQYGVFERGAEVYAWLKTGQNVGVGDALCSGGAGNLVATTASGGNDDEEIVGYAMEALNNSTGSDARLRIEVA